MKILHIITTEFYQFVKTQTYIRTCRLKRTMRD